MTETQDDIASRDDVEAALWRWSGWKADQRLVDELLKVVDRYARASQPSPQVPWPEIEAKVQADKVLAAARREAAEIVREAQSKASMLENRAQRVPAIRPEGLKRDPLGNVTIEGFRDAEDGVWVRLGPLPAVAAAGNRKCTSCRGVKPVSRFRRDASSNAGRRTQCLDCENLRRRRRRAELKQDQVISKEVQ